MLLKIRKKAHAYLRQATEGSGQDEFYQVLDWFEKAIEGISELQQKLTGIQQNLNRMANYLESGEGAPPSASPPLQSAGQGAVKAAELLAKMPKRTNGSGKTSGVWLDDEGREHGPLVSGREVGYKEATEVLRELRIGPARGELWVAAHVEVKLAAQLRRTNARHVTLIIDNQPCDDGRWSCDRVLPKILRPGQSVTIYWPDGVRTYRGREA